MKSQPADKRTHTNQILSQHKYKYNTKLGNAFSLDEQRNNEERKRGEKKADWKKCKHIFDLPLDKRWAIQPTLSHWGLEVFSV